MKQGKHVSLSGTERWYRDGRLHREDGPAVTYYDGTECWFINGLRHRADGPAIIYDDGSESWYLNGKEVDPMAVLIQEVEKLDESK
jgi:hypothetical protein